MRWLGVAALVAVIFQGLLGGMRVRLDERLLAKIHGCFGPAFFALLGCAGGVHVAFLAQSPAAASDAVGRQAAHVGLADDLLRLFADRAGRQLRHVSLALDASGFRVAVLFHLLVAAVLVVHVVCCSRCESVRSYRGETLLLRPALALLALVVVQLVLGASTWVLNYGWPSLVRRLCLGESFIVRAGKPDAGPGHDGPRRHWLADSGHVAAGRKLAVVARVSSFGRMARPLHWHPGIGGGRMSTSTLVCPTRAVRSRPASGRSLAAIMSS